MERQGGDNWGFFQFRQHILPVPPGNEMLERVVRFTKFSMDVTDQTQKESTTVSGNRPLNGAGRLLLEVLPREVRERIRKAGRCCVGGAYTRESTATIATIASRRTTFPSMETRCSCAWTTRA
jgi:hypothetical protein